MPSLKKLSALLYLLPFVAALDTTSHCGQWDTVVSGPFTMYLDLWGMSGATSGSQCSTFVSQSGNTASWKTTWTWTGGTGVKSFSNMALTSGLNVQLSQIKSIPSTWSWSQSSTGTIVADVAYDLFTSNTAGGSNVNEIMIWMANYSAGPISATYGSDGQPTPAKSSISLGGYTWNLYSGSNGSNQVYSFLPTSGTITSFNADINVFLQYLTTNMGVSTSQYLTTLQAGTEPTSGSATLTTTTYSVVVNTGATTSAPPTTTTSHSTTSTTTTTASGATQSQYGQCGGQGFTGPTVCASPYTCTYSNPYYSQCL